MTMKLLELQQQVGTVVSNGNKWDLHKLFAEDGRVEDVLAASQLCHYGGIFSSKAKRNGRWRPAAA
jgi:hypothetical protein